jgi:DNA repair exonuclease SbcCD ATPase subunit
MALKKANFVTDPSMTPETPDVADTANFLRRFADLMSNGHNARYLQHAAVLLETLTARVTAATDEEQLWRYKYETVTHHADALEAQCDVLKRDIEGHVDITTSILTERDALKAALQAREAELSGIGAALSRERGEFARRLEAHEQVQVELRAAFDREFAELNTTLEARSEELDQLRRAFEREREEHAAGIKTHEGELAEIRVAFDRENDALKAKVAALEAKRAELRTAFDRISELRNQTVERQGGASRAVSEKSGSEAEAKPSSAQPGDRNPTAAETSAVVPKTTLRQARAQFEYLARECIPREDIASQVMCELGAYTMDLALIADEQTDHSPVGEVALSILALPAADTI